MHGKCFRQHPGSENDHEDIQDQIYNPGDIKGKSIGQDMEQQIPEQLGDS